MTRVLIVDDSPDQARMVSLLLEHAGYGTESAVDGKDGLEAIARRKPDVVLTDLVMPRLDGLGLVKAVRELHPDLPVILMTAYGSGETAMRALQSGAASYVPKRQVRESLVDTVGRVHEVAQERQEEARVLENLTEWYSRFVLTNDPSLIPPLVSYLQQAVSAQLPDADRNQLMQVGMALHEALSNAILHGNLEVSSEIRETSWLACQELIEERRTQPAFAGRLVEFEARLNQATLTCVVRDDGAGFDRSLVPDPLDPENLLSASGRGLYLIKTFMDEVTFNDAGNRITLFKELTTCKDQETHD